MVRSDAIKQFASSLLQARPIWRTDFIHDLADRLVNPRPPAELEPVALPVRETGQQPASQARAIFNASEQANPFDENDLGFAFEEDGVQSPQNLRESNQAHPQSRPKPAPSEGKFLGMGNTQIVLLAGMLIVECCVILGFGIILYLYL